MINKKFVRSILIGLILSSSIVVLLILLSGFLFLVSGKFPQEYLNYLMLGILGIGGLVGGYISARLNNSSGLIIGLVTGLLLYLIILIAGLATSFGTVTIFTLYKLLVLAVLGAVGGVLGVNKKDKIRIK
jgi:putative membrane protein (TIGR04086 family)